MESKWAEWVTSRIGAVTGLLDIDAQLLVLSAMLFEFRPTAGSEWHARAIVNGAALQRSGSVNEAGIVNIAKATIGFEDQGSLTRDGVRMSQLDVCGLPNHC